MKPMVQSGKRKSAIARATIRAGKGKVRVNKVLLSNVLPVIARAKIQEPLLLAGDMAEKTDIEVSVAGGGVIAQAEAARLAIAKSLAAFTRGKKLRETFLDYDRNMLVADVRRKEVKKPNRHGKARAKVQKSYR